MVYSKHRGYSMKNVSANLEVLEAEVMQLAPVERSHLLERLIASFDSDPEVEEAWEREADRRESELESGLVVAVSGPEAIVRLRARFSR
jgi:putative addiction module component (TIGR02574 family)